MAYQHICLLRHCVVKWRTGGSFCRWCSAACWLDRCSSVSGRPFTKQHTLWNNLSCWSRSWSWKKSLCQERRFNPFGISRVCLVPLLNWWPGLVWLGKGCLISSSASSRPGRQSRDAQIPSPNTSFLGVPGLTEKQRLSSTGMSWVLLRAPSCPEHLSGEASGTGAKEQRLHSSSSWMTELLLLSEGAPAHLAEEKHFSLNRMLWRPLEGVL